MHEIRATILPEHLTNGAHGTGECRCDSPATGIINNPVAIALPHSFAFSRRGSRDWLRSMVRRLEIDLSRVARSHPQRRFRDRRGALVAFIDGGERNTTCPPMRRALNSFGFLRAITGISGS
jgi:hypothetical protein